MNEGVERHTNFFAAAEKRQFNDTGGADNLGADLLEQRQRGAERAASGEQIVEDDDPLAWRDRIALNFDRIGTIFKIVFMADRFAG